MTIIVHLNLMMAISLKTWERHFKAIFSACETNAVCQKLGNFKACPNLTKILHNGCHMEVHRKPFLRVHNRFQENTAYGLYDCCMPRPLDMSKYQKQLQVKFDFIKSIYKIGLLSREWAKTVILRVCQKFSKNSPKKAK